MDWKALLLVSALSSFQLVVVAYVRGHQLRLTLRHALHDIPASMTTVHVHIHDRRGTSAVIRASSNREPAEGD